MPSFMHTWNSKTKSGSLIIFSVGPPVFSWWQQIYGANVSTTYLKGLLWQQKLLIPTEIVSERYGIELKDKKLVL